MERALLLICALLLNALFGGLLPLPGLQRLGRLPELALRLFERKLNREHRSLTERERRGTLLVIVVMVASVLLGVAVQALLTQELRFIGLALLALLMPVGSSWRTANRVRKCLLAHDPQAAQRVLSTTPARHHLPADSYGLARITIEWLAVQCCEQLLTPICGYLLFGWPGLFSCKAICLMECAITRPGLRAQGFGKAAHALYEVLIIPSRLGALLWLIAALFIPGIDIAAAWRTLTPLWLTAGPRQFIIAAPATLLRLSLGGPASFYAYGQWIGTGTPLAIHTDIKRAQLTFILLNIVLLPLLWLFTL